MSIPDGLVEAGWIGLCRQFHPTHETLPVHVEAAIDRDVVEAIVIAVATRTAELIDEYAESEAVRTRWDGTPGILGNWVNGIRDGARLLRGELRPKGTMTIRNDGDEPTRRPRGW